MRKLNDHIVSADQSHQLSVEVLDQPGAGGACHLYGIYGFHTPTNASAEDKDQTCMKVLFQNGPIKEVGVNGVTQEALLTIVIDRLRSFQSGPYACRENAIALTKLEEALMWLQRRTMDRIRRGVEGSHIK